MLVNGTHYRTIWINPEDTTEVCIIDQTQLPFSFKILKIRTYKRLVQAIKDMEVRGAGLIGASGAYAVYLAILEASEQDDPDTFLDEAVKHIITARPTAINLSWAVERILKVSSNTSDYKKKSALAFKEAATIADEDASYGAQIGLSGLPLIEEASRAKEGHVVNILTHCNAGWLALVDYGTALSPIYAAHQKGIKVHVWVDETRPRNQGAMLTAWELQSQGIPHTIITDNAGGLLMQKGMVDMVIVGSDRTTYTGDVCNKIGTYLKALAAQHNNVPFYVAVYSSSFDWQTADGVKDIPIEQRDGKEVSHIKGINTNNELEEICITAPSSPVSNFAFDVTPAHLVTGLITERGVCKADAESIKALFPEKFPK